MNKKTKTFTGIAYGLLGSAMFGGYILINRFVYTTYPVDVFSYTATFSLWAGFFALLSMGWSRSQKKFKLFKRSTLPVIWVGMLAGVGVGFIVVGGKYTTAINASILSTISIVPTVWFAQHMTKERLSDKQRFWLVVMLVGLYLAVVGLRSMSLNKGDIIILGSAIILGYTNTRSKVLMRHHKSDFVGDVRLISAGLLFGLIALIFVGSDFLVTSAGVWPTLGGLAYWLTIKFFYSSIHRISPSKAIVLLNAHPAITPFIGILILSEPYDIAKLIGSAVIMASIYFINNEKTTRRKA